MRYLARFVVGMATSLAVLLLGSALGIRPSFAEVVLVAAAVVASVGAQGALK